MAMIVKKYRNGTYVAFDGNGEVNPTKSDLKYFQILKGWKENNKINFTFNNSHDKTYQVKDTSSEETLNKRLNERLSNSKNLLVIVSDTTNYDRGKLNYEIERASKAYGLPIIVAYTGKFDYISVDENSTTGELSIFGITEKPVKKILLNARLPKGIESGIKNKTINCIHIPFKLESIKNTINEYDCHNKLLQGCSNHWGIIDDLKFR